MNLSNSNILFAFLLTLIAGLSTGIGSIISLYVKQTNIKFLSASLGFSAGVMIYISMIELFPASKESLCLIYGSSGGYLITTLSFFTGILLIALIDKLVPSFHNPHEFKDSEDMEQMSKKNDLLRLGMFSALAITIHNFPEGIATFSAALKDGMLGISIAIAVAIHNIPEGIAVSVPIYYSTGNRKKAFIYSFASGLSEPLGAIIGYFILRRFLNETMFGIVFAVVAGIMVYISLDELLPSAEKYGKHHLAIYGLILGMGVMAASLLIFK